MTKKALALTALDDLYGDTSVSKKATLDALYELKEAVQGMIEPLEEELEGEGIDEGDDGDDGDGGDDD